MAAFLQSALIVVALFAVIPATPVAAVAPNFGLQLNGTSQYVTFGQASALGVTNFTLELWFKRTGAGAGTSTGTGGLLSAIP
jgi:hypothetical protein